jgi:hypothetical protein
MERNDLKHAIFLLVFPLVTERQDTRIDSTQIAKKFHPLATGPAKSNFPYRELTCRKVNSAGSRSALFPAISAGSDRMFAPL